MAIFWSLIPSIIPDLPDFDLIITFSVCTSHNSPVFRRIHNDHQSINWQIPAAIVFARCFSSTRGIGLSGNRTSSSHIKTDVQPWHVRWLSSSRVAQPCFLNAAAAFCRSLSIYASQSPDVGVLAFFLYLDNLNLPGPASHLHAANSFLQ